MSKVKGQGHRMSELNLKYCIDCRVSGVRLYSWVMEKASGGLGVDCKLGPTNGFYIAFRISWSLSGPSTLLGRADVQRSHPAHVFCDTSHVHAGIRDFCFLPASGCDGCLRYGFGQSRIYLEEFGRRDWNC